MLNITELLINDANVLEIYICPKQHKNNIINISLDNEYIKKLKDNFKITKTYTYNIFYRKNLSYIYDECDDNQIVYMNTLIKDLYINTKNNLNDFYIFSYKENKLPTHYFPCTNDYDYFTTITYNEMKITNRISILIKNDNNINTAYIQYKHTTNIDIDKIQETINYLFKKISKL